MMMELEHLTFGDTLKNLGQGIEISDASVLDSIIRQLKENTEEKNANNAKKIIEMVSLKFSALGRSCLKNADFDQKILEDLEKLYHEFDKFSWLGDVDSLEDFCDFAINEKIFAQKIKEWKNKKKNERI